MGEWGVEQLGHTHAGGATTTTTTTTITTITTTTTTAATAAADTAAAAGRPRPPPTTTTKGVSVCGGGYDLLAQLALFAHEGLELGKLLRMAGTLVMGKCTLDTGRLLIMGGGSHENSVR